MAAVASRLAALTEVVERAGLGGDPDRMPAVAEAVGRSARCASDGHAARPA
jgi:hypothetical protein